MVHRVYNIDVFVCQFLPVSWVPVANSTRHDVVHLAWSI